MARKSRFPGCTPSSPDGRATDGYGNHLDQGGLRGAIARAQQAAEVRSWHEAEERGKAARREERKMTRSSRALERMQGRRGPSGVKGDARDNWGNGDASA